MSDEARILTVRNPWAWAIIHAGKTVENRATNVVGDYRGPLLIHAAKAYADGWSSPVLAGIMNRHGAVHQEPQPWHDHAGMIIGVVDLVDSHPVDACIKQQRDGDWFVCSEWAERAGHHLVLANPRALDEPLPYTGTLGLRRTGFFVSGDWLGMYVDPGHSACTPYGCPPSCYSEPVARLVATS